MIAFAIALSYLTAASAVGILIGIDKASEIGAQYDRWPKKYLAPAVMGLIWPIVLTAKIRSTKR